MRKKGIDISEHQGAISSEQWKEIKKNCDFVILRYGYRGYGSGQLKVDSQFENNLRNCRLHEIPFGIYFFTQAVNESEAKEEAELILNHIDFKPKYGIWCDTELANSGKGRADKLTKASRTKAVTAFCEAVKARGIVAGVYASYYWLKDNLDAEKLSSYPIWCACYTESCLYKGMNLALWQCSEKNTFGIKGFKGLDCNYEVGVYFEENQEEKPQKNDEKKSHDQIVSEILEGKWGNGDARIKKLTDAGYNYSEIQKSVNIKLYGGMPYRVKSGDTLWGLASKYLGNGNKYIQIMQASGITSTVLQIGQQLVIPYK